MTDAMDRDQDLNSESTAALPESEAEMTELAQATMAEEEEVVEGEEQTEEGESEEAAAEEAPAEEAPPADGVPVARPLAGQTIEITSEPGQRYVILFDPTEAQVQIDGGNFSLLFEDGGRVVFQNLISQAQAGTAPILQVGGTDISGEVIVGQALALTGEQTTLDTAAGPTEGGDEGEGGGASRYSDNFGDIISVLNAQPDIPYVDLAFGLTELEVIDLDPLVEDTPSIPLPSLFANPAFVTVSERFLPPRSPEGSLFNPADPFPIGDETNPTAIFEGQLDFSPEASIQEITLNGTSATPLLAPTSFDVMFSDGLTFSFTAQEGDLVIEAPNGSVLWVRADGSFLYILADNTLDHTNTSGVGADDSIVTETFGYTVGTSDGRSASSTVEVNVQDDGPIAVADVFSVPTGAPSTSGNVTDNDELGADDSTVVTIILNPGTPNEQVIQLNGQTQQIQGAAGVLEISPNGDFVYTPDLPIPPGGVTDSFNYVLQDKDGDLSQAPLNIDFKPIARPNNPATDPDDTIVIEDADPDQSNFNQPGVNGNILADDTSGTDPFAAVPISAISFNSGVPAGDVTTDTTTFTDRVVFEYRENGVGDVVWRLTVFTQDGPGSELAGDYDFQLLNPFQHADGNGANFADMVFDYTIEDSTGDMDSSTLTIRIVDDVPIAVDDTGTVNQGVLPLMAAGDVTDNDDLGADVVTDVTGIRVNAGDPITALVGGTATIQGTFGELVINADGTYTYTVNQPIGPNDNPSDSFVYTITDDDGDVAEATLNIEFGITAKPDGPGTDNENDPVIEDGPGDGSFTPTSITENLLDNDNPGSDGYGTPPVTDASFTGTYAPEGVMVNVTKDDTSDPNLIVFSSDDGVWRMTIDQTTGQYTFELLNRYEHDALQGMNDAFQTFSYTIQDATGDTASSTVTIQIIDDVPVAMDDVGSLDLKAMQTQITGNVLVGDAIGGVADDQGGDASIVDQINGIAVPTGMTLSVQGTFGLLEIGNDGAYTYTINRPIPENQQLAESFVYRIMDQDSDTSTATLTIDFSIDARDDGNPDPNDENSLVVEEGLPDGTFVPGFLLRQHPGQRCPGLRRLCRAADHEHRIRRHLPRPGRRQRCRGARVRRGDQHLHDQLERRCLDSRGQRGLRRLHLHAERPLRPTR